MEPLPEVGCTSQRKRNSVVLGFDSLCTYQGDTKYIGIIAGRVANRTQNSLFRLKGIDYQLERMISRSFAWRFLGFGKKLGYGT